MTTPSSGIFESSAKISKKKARKRLYEIRTICLCQKSQSLVRKLPRYFIFHRIVHRKVSCVRICTISDDFWTAACGVWQSSYLLSHRHPLSLQLQFSALHVGYYFSHVMCHTVNPLSIIIMLQLAHHHKVATMLLQAIIALESHHHTVTMYHIVTSHYHIYTGYHIVTGIVT